ncbi:MAG TPA: hypothetical protein VLC07_08685, partial [Solirubrobacterales bacterium]|nr:hypothetical protein [Solirubrobacterales bacterium]
MSEALRKGTETIATYQQGFDTLRSGAVTRMSDIAEVTQVNIGRINEVWAHNPPKWHQAMAESMKATIGAIKSGMDQGVIDTQVGQSRIKELMRDLKIVEGRDPYGIAEGFASSWKQAGKINNAQIDHMLAEMRRMPKGSREAAQNAMIQMARAMENKGELVKGSVSRLNSALVTKFGKTNQQIVSGVSHGAEAIAGLFSNLVNTVSGYLSDLGVNVNSILKAFGVSKGVNFTVKTVKGAAGAVAGAAKDIVGSITGGGQNKQTGGFIVPGSGSGDRPGFAGEVGAFILNREATRAYGFDRGGMVPLALEPGERYFTRREVSAMGGARTLEAMNQSVPRFQKGGELGKPQVSGPAGPLLDLGQHAANRGYHAAQEYIKAHRPHDVVPAGGGLMTIDGKPVAEWIAKILIAARKAGVEFTVSSGYRSEAEQAAIYNSGVRPAAVPGTSHHEGKAFPSGAVDISPGAEALAAWLGHSRYAQTLIYAGAKDPVHFSHPYGGGYMLGGLIQALQKGGEATAHFTPFEEEVRRAAGQAWNRAAGLYGSSGDSPMPELYVAKGMTARNGDVGQVQSYKDGRRMVLFDKGWARQLLQGGDFAEETLLHEWAHYFQRSGLARWEAEGGATDFARWAAPQVFPGFDDNRYPRGYRKFAERVQKNKGDDWIRQGQFMQSGGQIQALQKGGMTVTGKVSWFGGGATAGGSNTSQPGLALNLNPGTESGWNNATTRGWRDASLAGHPVYGQTTITGHTANLPITDMGPAASTGRAIDVTEGGVRKLGLSTSSFPTDAIGKVVIEGGGGSTAKGLTEGQRKIAEGKKRKANSERHLKALEQEVGHARSPLAKQSKLWRLIKFWGRTGIFEEDEKSHILQSVQEAAAQTKPTGAVNVLSHLADYAKGHGEITGKDPSNFRDMEKAIERAMDRGREERKKTVERQKKHKEAIHNKVAAKIANRAAFPDWVARLDNLRTEADKGEEYASQLVTLEPENITDAYVDTERGAYGSELNKLLSWRNTTIQAEEAASREIANFEAQIAHIESLKTPVPEDAKAFGKLLDKAGGKQKNGKALGGLIQEFAGGGKTKGISAKAFGDAIEKANGKGSGGGGGGAGPSAYDKAAYKIPLLQEAIANAKTMRDETWAGELEEIQGLSGPGGILESLPSEPVAGAFGGRIFEVQNAIRELGLKVGDASSSINELKELEAQLNVDWHKRFLVSEAQRNTIADFEASYPGGNYAGTFAKGGYIGAGQWGI